MSVWWNEKRKEYQREYRRKNRDKVNEYARELQRKHKDKIKYQYENMGGRERHQEYYIKNRGKIRLAQNERNKLPQNKMRNKKRFDKWSRDNPEKVLDAYLRNNFGITLSKYNELSVNQNHKCAICKKHKVELEVRLAVDHDHFTGKVRGLLCRNCNSMLGFCHDNKFILARAIEYLTTEPILNEAMIIRDTK